MNNYAIEKTYEPKVVPKFEIGATISIKSQSERKRVAFKGEIVAITSNFVTLRNKKSVRESFMFNDFKCGYLFLATNNVRR